jgi:hypothetical protein
MGMKEYMEQFRARLTSVVNGLVAEAMEGFKMLFTVDGEEDSGAFFEIGNDMIERKLGALDELGVKLSRERLAGFIDAHPEISIAETRGSEIIVFFEGHVCEQARRQQLAMKTASIKTAAADATMKRVYIASPYAGDVEHNENMARQYCRYATSQGVIPLAPHLLFTQFLNDLKPEERALGCRMGIELLDSCDELWVFGRTVSSGMAAEIAHAEKTGLPTRYITSIEVTREIKDMISIYTGEKNERLERLSNSGMEVYDGAKVPEQVIEWGDKLYKGTRSCLFFARMGEQYGVFAINEYDSTICKCFFDGNPEAMRAAMQRDAEAIAKTGPIRDSQVYTGHGTGFGGCDEIGVFISCDTPTEQARRMLMAIDENTYQLPSMEQEPGSDMEHELAPC